jgi:hypothetical protein
MNKLYTLQFLLSKRLIWQKERPSHWIARVVDKIFFLRMNDFPAEPMYSVLDSENNLIGDIEEASESWDIE